MSKEHMHNGNAARRVHDGCSRLTPLRGAQMKGLCSQSFASTLPTACWIMSRCTVRLATTFQDFSIRVSRRENNMPVAKQFLGDRMGKARGYFLQAELLPQSMEAIYDLNYWSNWK